EFAASTTTTSPGCAMSRLLWTMRLSPGYTFTVHAGPMTRSDGSVRFLISGDIVYRRFIRSEIVGVSNRASRGSASSGGRSNSRRTRKPGPGCISADFGLLTTDCVADIDSPPLDRSLGGRSSAKDRLSARGPGGPQLSPGLTGLGPYRHDAL